jgi:hypothetical protein
VDLTGSGFSLAVQAALGNVPCSQIKHLPTGRNTFWTLSTVIEQIQDGRLSAQATDS